MASPNNTSNSRINNLNTNPSISNLHNSSNKRTEAQRSLERRR